MGPFSWDFEAPNTRRGCRPLLLDLLHDLHELAALRIVNNLHLFAIVVHLVPLLVVQLLHVVIEIAVLVHLQQLLLDHLYVVDRDAVQHRSKQLLLSSAQHAYNVSLSLLVQEQEFLQLHADG
jgi:hypothetical protein